MNHWKIKGKQIVVWNNVGNVNEPIAEIIDERPARQMLRYAQLAEDVEHLVDLLKAGKLDEGQMSEKTVALVEFAIDDLMTRGQVPCPEVEVYTHTKSPKPAGNSS